MAPGPASDDPTGRRVVVDGSNLATEGRNTPSLAQLDEAVRAFAEERPNDEIIVVVDASFGYRIDESERKMFEEAEEAGEIVSPPAGAIGRGDGFLLRIADRIDADVLSNDSFQEFHGEYTWLFDEGRLVGGKPVPGVGWIFTPRTPVRGPKSRVATRDAARARKRTAPAKVAVAAAAAARAEPTADAIAEATAEAIAPDAPKTARRGRRRRGGSEAGAPEAVNEPLPFITFIAEHPLGSEVEGTVESFTSHGAFVIADGARCYAPVSGLGDPPPRSAKEVLKRGEDRTFVIQALDAPRRGIELALPGLAKLAGAPTDETVEAEIDAGSHPAAEAAAVGSAGSAEPQPDSEPAPEPEPARPVRARRSRARGAEPEPVPGVPAAEPALPEPEAKPARRSRKKAAAAAVDGPAVVAAEPAGEPPAAPARRSRKKAVAAVEETPPPAPVDEPPKKAARTRKKAAAAAVAEPTAEAEPALAATAKKRAAKKRAAPDVPAAPGAPAPPATPRPRRSAVKKAAAPEEEPVARKAGRKSTKKAASP